MLMLKAGIWKNLLFTRDSKLNKALKESTKVGIPCEEQPKVQTPKKIMKQNNINITLVLLEYMRLQLQWHC